MKTSAHTLQRLNVLVHMLVLRILSQHHPPDNMHVIIGTYPTLHPYLSVSPTVRLTLDPSKLVSENPVKVQPDLTPTVSMSFLIVVREVSSLTNLSNLYLYFQSPDQYLNLLCSPLFIWRLHPPEQSWLSKTMAQADGGIFGHGRGPLVSFT